MVRHQPCSSPVDQESEKPPSASTAATDSAELNRPQESAQRQVRFGALGKHLCLRAQMFKHGRLLDFGRFPRKPNRTAVTTDHTRQGHGCGKSQTSLARLRETFEKPPVQMSERSRSPLSNAVGDSVREDTSTDGCVLARSAYIA